MAEADATRDCVVCGSTFARDGKMVVCSDACRAERQRHQSRASHLAHGHTKGPQEIHCKRCGVAFVGVASKVYCTTKCKDAERRKTEAWNESNARRKLKPRKRYKRGPRACRNRSADYAAAKAKRAEAREAAALPLLMSKIAHSAQLNPRMTQAIRVARGTFRAKHTDPRHSGSAALRQDPERYAKALQRWRAKGFKRKTGKAMPDDGTVTASIMFAGSRCLYCDCKLNTTNRTHDHMDPLSAGGVNSACNIAPCCHSCNSSKGPKPFAMYVKTLTADHRSRAVKFYEKRNGPMEQMGLRLAA